MFKLTELFGTKDLRMPPVEDNLSLLLRLSDATFEFFRNLGADALGTPVVGCFPELTELVVPKLCFFSLNKGLLLTTVAFLGLLLNYVEPSFWV